MAPRVIECWRLPPALRKQSQSERAAFLQEFALPVDKARSLTEPAELSLHREISIVIEFVVWIVFIFLPLAAPIVLLCLPITIGLAYCVVVLLLCVLPLKLRGKPWLPFWDLCQYDSFLRYFSFRIIFEQEEFFSDRTYLFALVPHGVWPASLFSLAYSQVHLPNVPLRPAGASVTVSLPYWRQVMSWIGGMTASKPSFISCLRKEGMSASTFIDGIHGMFAGASEGTEILYIKNRKGFAKLALQTGTPLVPCYAFGQTRLCKVIQDPMGIMVGLSRALGMSIILPAGVLGCTPMPMRYPLTLAMGAPIPVEKVESPSQEQIDDVHAKLLAGIEAVFEKHKERCDFGAAKLSFQ